MLEKNFEFRQFGRKRKSADRNQYAALGVIACCLLLAALFPIPAAAQSASQSALAPVQGAAYGTGMQTPLRYDGEQVLENAAALTVGASAFYDDNVQATNANRVADEALSLNANFAVQKQSSHLTFNFDYQPFFLIYRQTSGYDRLNHAANVNLAYRLSPRVILGLHDVFTFENGVLPSLSGQSLAGGPLPPNGLNQGIFPYTTRTLTNTGGAALTFVKSRRHSFTFSADYNQLELGSSSGSGGAGPLYNGLGVSAGLEYQYRITDHITFGVLRASTRTPHTRVGRPSATTSVPKLRVDTFHWDRVFPRRLLLPYLAAPNSFASLAPQR